MDVTIISLCWCSIWRNVCCWYTIMHKIITSEIYIYIWDVYQLLFFMFFKFFFAKLVTKNCFIFTKTYTFLYFLNIREFLFYFEKKIWMQLTIICKKKISEKYIALSLGSCECSPSLTKGTHVRRLFQAKEKSYCKIKITTTDLDNTNCRKKQVKKGALLVLLLYHISTVLYTLFRD